MDLSSAVFRDILGPLAAFKDIPDLPSDESLCEAGNEAPPIPKGELHGPALSSITQAEGTSNSTVNIATTSPPPPSLHSTPSSPTTPSPAQPTTNPTPPNKYKWTIQAANPDGRRFFALPQFALDKPPLRIDVYLPPLEEYHPEVKAVLKPQEVIYTASRDELHKLGIVTWLEGVLERWAAGYDGSEEGRFEREYGSLPFGSRVFVTIGGLPGDGEGGGGVEVESEVYLVPDYDVEQGMLTVEVLRGMWGGLGDGGADGGWPEVIDLERLRLRRQVHEAISIVTISGNHDGDGDSGREWVFKSLTRDTRYLYNELKMLLTLRPHDNLIPRPRYIVTKKGRFGGRKGVCGFVLEYFNTGSLKQHLLDHSASTSPSASAITLPQKLHWAKQITRVLMHINAHSDVGFYPDLKPDNIVLRPIHHSFASSPPPEIQLDAILLDLEQRGGWFTWSPPEVAYLEYLEIVASASTDEDGDSGGCGVTEEVRDEIIAELGEYYSRYYRVSGCEAGSRGWEASASNDQGGGYYNSGGGFSAPWLGLLYKRRGAMSEMVRGVVVGDGGDVGDDGSGSVGDEGTPSERALDLEKAQVFMLGKLLWCIFEEEALLRCGIDHELLQDRGVGGDGVGGVGRRKGFPEFEKTPWEVRELIRRCTAGAGGWEGGDVARARGWRAVLDGEGKLVPAVDSVLGTGRGGGGSRRQATEQDTQRVATMFWRQEVGKARAYARDVLERRKRFEEGEKAHAKRTGRENSPFGENGKRDDISLLQKIRTRPTFAEVLTVLEGISG